MLQAGSVFVVLALFAETPPPNTQPGYEQLDAAYKALRVNDYDKAVPLFRRAIELAPKRASIRKDLAYTLLKIGENEEARDQFGEAVVLDPTDDHSALEYAFLCYETGKPIDARRTFDRLRQSAASAESRATAQRAFENIDQPLRDGIARWKDAVERTPDAYSAHEELAQLAEKRDELELSAEHFRAAWKLRPEHRPFLLDLGRVLKKLNRAEESFLALLAASRGAEPRTAEAARKLLPARYPYVYEFENALKLDPSNTPLRRELAYLLLEMQRHEEAEKLFQELRQVAPDDRLSTAQLGFLKLRRDDAAARPLLDQVLQTGDDELADRVRAALHLPQTLRRRDETPAAKVNLEAKQLADKSLKAGFLNDAVRYLRVAHETDPVDFDVILQLGWAHNILKQDKEAVRWFNLARRSPSKKVAGEAETAYRNLIPGLARFQTIAWLYPFYSSRFKDAFSYAQIKTELNLGSIPLRPYLSARFVGDARRSAELVPGMPAQALSENSVIVAAGIRTRVWHHLMAWGEAGQAVRYLGRGAGYGLFTPDYRGGVGFHRGFGRLLTPSSKGWFAETGNDAVFVSRFDRDFMVYSQNRTGYTMAQTENGGFQWQPFWAWNATTDVKGFAWANFVETGPGVRFRSKVFPASVWFNVQATRGFYLIDDGSQPHRTFSDIRAGFWYAFVR